MRQAQQNALARAAEMAVITRRSKRKWTRRRRRSEFFVIQRAGAPAACSQPRRRLKVPDQEAAANGNGAIEARLGSLPGAAT